MTVKISRRGAKPVPTGDNGISLTATIRPHTVHLKKGKKVPSATDLGLRGLFSVTLFISSAMLFWIQLLVSKLLLPILGGSSAVWNTCLVFFQACLLLGYLYAHLSVRRGGRRGQNFLHPLLLLAAGASLPISVAGLVAPDAAANPIPWLLASLSLMIGMPFIVLSGTAPVLQAWFSRSAARSAADPYYLYAASNLGSLAALVSYPTLVEPNLTLATQGHWWADGYFLLVLLTLGCALVAGRGGEAASPIIQEHRVAHLPVAARAAWLLLSFVPSSLLLGVTSHLTTDIAAVPLLWVIPLILYLLSFILAFQTSVALSRRRVAQAQAALLALLAGSFLFEAQAEPIAFFLLHLAGFFATALFCHLELAHRRPHAAQLTEFYLFLALGGALGGVFNALLAPVLFDRIIEYPLLLVLACLLRPGRWPGRQSTRAAGAFDIAAPALLAGILLLIKARFGPEMWQSTSLAAGAIALTAAGVTLSFQARPLRFGFGVAALLAAGLSSLGGDRVLVRIRNFYGQVSVVTEADPPAHVLYNGPEGHGLQSLLPQYRLTPFSEYHADGPLGHIFAALVSRRPLRRVGVVGLGAGMASCYAQAGEPWTYYEINPAVVAIAEDPRFFTYLRDCPARPAMVLGDARLSLAREPDTSFDLLILDAFNAASIPVHLLTQEAVALYMQKLTANGLLVFHIDNNHLDLAPVLGDIAASLGLAAKYWNDQSGDEEDDDKAEPTPKDDSEWAVLSRDSQSLAAFSRDPVWQDLPHSRRRRPWTDDFSNLLGAIGRN